MFHTSNFHKRYFILDFGYAMILVKKKEGDDKPHKKYPLNQVRACIAREEQELENTLDHSLKRNKSLLSKLRKDDDEICPWNFSFELQLTDRSLELYAPNRIERDKWVRVF